MKRRQLLQRLSVGGALLTAGCAAVGERPKPFNFAIVNRRDQSYAVEFTLRDDADEVLVAGAVDIAPRSASDDEYTVLNFDDLVRVRNGDVIDARVRIGDETFETAYEVTCNRSENAENDLFFDIPHPQSGHEIGFRGSDC